MRNRELGEQGENLAVSYLRSKGYRILERNFRIRSGEIDIIAFYQKCLVFVEVKTRRSQKFGTAAEAVHYQKRRRIVRTALFYLTMKPLSYDLIRFDVIEVYYTHSSPSIHHIVQAFDANE